MIRRCVVIGAVVMSCVSLSLADGGFVKRMVTGRAGDQAGVSSPHQRGVIIEDGAHEILLLQTTYRGPAADFAWIIPVPGQPGPDDVFMVGEKVIPYILEETAPPVYSTVEAEAPLGPGMFAQTAGEKGGGGAGGVVTVHARMEVGDYDAAVLSATGTGALMDWLNVNGYQLPDGGEGVIQQYVDKHWYFVALKVLPEVIAERPVMSDVRPIGIRFPADPLVYPLHISRLSSPEKTALVLVVLAGDQVRCDQLDWARLSVNRRLPPGSSYAVIRRRAVQRTPSSAVLEEGSRRPRVLMDRAGLEDDSWVFEYPEGVVTRDGRFRLAREEEWSEGLRGKLITPRATRLWTILDRDEMEDLTFTRDHDPDPGGIRIERTATVGGTFARSPLAVLLAALVFLVAATLQAGRTPLPAWLVRIEFVVGAFLFLFPGMWMLIPFGIFFVFASSGWWVAGRSDLDVAQRVEELERTPLPALDRKALLLATFVVGGFMAWAIALTTDSAAPRIHPANAGLTLTRAWYAIGALLPVWGLWMLASVAWVLGVIALLSEVKRPWPRPAVRASREVLGILIFGWLATVVLAMALPGVLESGLHRGPTPAEELYGLSALVVTLAAALAYMTMLAFGAVAPYATSRSRAIAQAMAHAVAIAGLLAAGSSFHLLVPAYAGVGQVERETSGRLSEALESIDDAIEEFREDTGCFPARLQDLAVATPPAQGLDASGNEVPVGGEWNGPYLTMLPVDTLTRRRDTWVYEVTGEPMVSSGGWSIVIRE